MAENLHFTINWVDFNERQFLLDGKTFTVHAFVCTKHHNNVNVTHVTAIASLENDLLGEMDILSLDIEIQKGLVCLIQEFPRMQQRGNN